MSSFPPVLSSAVTTSPVIELTEDVKQDLLADAEETGQVIVHGRFTCRASWELVRVWKTTYLIDRSSGHRSQLLFAENICMAPMWTALEMGETLRFTLIFEALPRGCNVFDFAEIIPEPGGFLVENIRRNRQDIYTIDLSAL
ncbi:hypothetical protein ACFSQD_12975 [Flavihumibacter stibioxidans]|uniref:Uncharacterized protein n=1 Tax=Flavihumibacter stibioxidans TaxID=1834163 RepID=A0ABR7M8Z1_9BACT|nr:hypothetical protein [Flavihumibacter stibioxidans]MBC6491495.1 hypothetical protein [Flavihumibacter stibioxidans]